MSALLGCQGVHATSSARSVNGHEYEPLLQAEEGSLSTPNDLNEAIAQLKAGTQRFQETGTLQSGTGADHIEGSNSVMGKIDMSGEGGSPEGEGSFFAKQENPDVIQFASMFYYVNESAGKVTAFVIRVGNLAHPCSVIFHTEDNSAKAGLKYKNTKGKIEFSPGEEMKSIEVKILEDDSFDTNLDFMIAIEDPIGCQLGKDARCRVVILDDDVFPTNTYRDEILADDEIELHKHGVHLLIAFIKFAFSRIPVVRWRSTWRLILDQCHNLNYLIQIWLNVYLVDTVLNLRDESTLENLWVPHQRLPTAGLVALAVIVPKAFLVWVEYLKETDLAVAGKVRFHLQSNLFRKYLYYNATSHSKVSAQELTKAMEGDVEEVTSAGFCVIFELARQTIKVGVILYFLVRKRPTMALPLLVYPICMAAVLNLRYEETLRLKDRVRDAEKETMTCLRESCDDINLIKEYNMRTAVVNRYETSILAQRDPGDDYGIYDFRTMLIMPWVTNLAIAVFMVVGGHFVLDGQLSLGAYLASIGIYKDAGDLFNTFYTHLKNCYGVIGPLIRLIRLLNMETDVAASMLQAKERMDGMMLELKAEEKMRQQFKLSPSTTSRFDMLHLKLVHVSLQNDRGGPTSPGLQDISVEVPQGKVVAILGPHGSGKFSMLKLLTGLVKPRKGEIYIPTHLRCLCVPNVPELFRNGNLLENLTFGTKGDYDKGRLIKLCEAVGLGKHTMGILEKELKQTEEQVAQAKKDGVPWYDQLSSSEMLKMHITRAFTLNPEVLLLHRPVDEMEADHAARLLDMLRQHVDNRGLYMTAKQKQVLRPRTVFFSTGEDRERSESASDVADAVWHLSERGFRSVAGGHATGKKTEKGENRIFQSWSQKLMDSQQQREKEEVQHKATKQQLESKADELELMKQENAEMRGTLNSLSSQAQRATRDLNHYYESELKSWEDEEKSRLFCVKRDNIPAPIAVSRALADIASAGTNANTARTNGSSARKNGDGHAYQSLLQQSPGVSPRASP